MIHVTAISVIVAGLVLLFCLMGSLAVGTLWEMRKKHQFTPGVSHTTLFAPTLSTVPPSTITALQTSLASSPFWTTHTTSSSANVPWVTTTSPHVPVYTLAPLEPGGTATDQQTHVFIRNMGPHTLRVEVYVVQERLSLPVETSEEEITAYRLCKILLLPDGRAALAPIGQGTSVITQYRLNTWLHAFCAAGVPHDAPDPDCQCGFYALKTPPQAEAHMAVVGVRLRGTVIEHEHGYRASDMIIDSVVVPRHDPHSALDLAEHLQLTPVRV